MAVKFKLNRVELAIICDALKAYFVAAQEVAEPGPSSAEVEALRHKLRLAWFKQDRALQKVCCPETRPVQHEASCALPPC